MRGSVMEVYKQVLQVIPTSWLCTPGLYGNVTINTVLDQELFY